MSYLFYVRESARVLACVSVCGDFALYFLHAIYFCADSWYQTFRWLPQKLEEGCMMRVCCQRRIYLCTHHKDFIRNRCDHIFFFSFFLLFIYLLSSFSVAPVLFGATPLLLYALSILCLFTECEKKKERKTRIDWLTESCSNNIDVTVTTIWATVPWMPLYKMMTYTHECV